MNMATYQNFKRGAVPSQVAQQLQKVTLPAPTRGLVLNENESFMQPGGALVLDNWKPTMKGSAIRGGCKTWASLPETTPVISMFNYISGLNNRFMFAANATKVYNVTSSTPALVASGQSSGNYVASQLANQGGDWLLACNDAGDYVLRFDGTTWTTLNAGQITGPAGSSVIAGHNLTYVWKYRNRFFFIEGGSMNAYYLPLNANQGALGMIPLSARLPRAASCSRASRGPSTQATDRRQTCFHDRPGRAADLHRLDPSTNWRQGATPPPRRSA